MFYPQYQFIYLATMDKILQSIYYSTDSGGGYQSLNRFVAAARRAGITNPHKELEQFYNSQTLTQITKTKKRPPIFRHFNFHGLRRNLGMDGMFLGQKSGRAR